METAELSSSNVNCVGTPAGFVSQFKPCDPIEPRPWKASRLLIKPEYMLHVNKSEGTSTPKCCICAQCECNGVLWVLTDSGWVAGLKNEGDKIVCVKTPDVDALIKLGAIDASDREAACEQIKEHAKTLALSKLTDEEKAALGL